MSTAHIAATASDFAATVLMPGDPLRAKYIAEHFLDEVKLVNQVRNMLAFTGTFQGHPISVMGSGMGMPSIGIYAHELFTQFGVERIVRVGSCGAYTEAMQLFDILLVNSAWTESTFAQIYSGEPTATAYPSSALTAALIEMAERSGANTQVAKVHSTDVFYRHHHDEFHTIYREQGCVAVDMEAFALFHIAKHLGKQAACLLTVSDILTSGAAASSQQREQAFSAMVEIALAATLP